MRCAQQAASELNELLQTGTAQQVMEQAPGLVEVIRMQLPALIAERYRDETRTVGS